MIVSVHIANIGVANALRLVAAPPKPAAVHGLRHADVAIAAPLSESIRKSPQLGRVALLAWWDDEAALDAFIANDRRAPKFVDGFAARLSPLRAHGSWPGLDAEVPKARSVAHDGGVVVLTLGRLRISQLPRFLRTSAKAEGAVNRADGLIWATGLARPPLVATCSLWESSDAARAYAYGNAANDAVATHPGAITQGNAKPFHKREAFIRFRPEAVSGTLGGKNPLSSEQVGRLSGIPHRQPE
jgi:hypothetical protein